MSEVGCDIVEYLKEFHTSEGKAVKARELCVLFNVHEKQLRNIVSDLRQNGEAICSSTYGYWYSRDPDDISTTLSRLVGQVDNMQKVIAGLNRIKQEYRKNYTPFFLLKGRYTMFKVGDAIKWMCPLDNDYTYGEITALRKSVATVKGTGLYSGITAEVHLRYIEKLMRGGGSVGSDCKKCSKRSITKAEL